jgi:Helix-turn-helix domain
VSDKRPFFTAAILCRRDLSDGAKLVYAGLDAFADADGLAFPSLARLADRVGKRRSSVARWLAELETAGTISRSPGRSSVGDQPARATVYRLLVSATTTMLVAGPEDGHDPLPGLVDGLVGRPSTGRDGLVVSPRWSRGESEMVSHGDSNKPINKPENKPPTRVASKSLDIVTPELLPAAPAGAGVRPAGLAPFDGFWASYPRRVAKVDAAKAWLQVTRDGATDLAAILAGLAAWVDHWRAEATESKFIPHPATWLRGRRWEDPPARPSTGDPRLVRLADHARRKGHV